MATTFKVLGQSAPTDTNAATLYTVGTGKSAIISTIAIANVAATATTASVYVRQAGAAVADSNAIVRNVAITGNSTIALTLGITLAAGDVISVATGMANVLTFHAFGQENS